MSTTDYSGMFVYKDGHIDHVLTSEGRMKRNQNGTYYPEYFIKDHLGNVRVVHSPSSGLSQATDYYPFGLEIPVYGVNDNQVKYNSKELQTDAKLNWYDYGARFYDPVIGRWHVVDRYAEKFHTNSPYSYALNNPISNIDINGDTTYRFDMNGSYLGMFDMDQKGIRGAAGNNKTYKDKDGNEQSEFNSEINFSFNDPSSDKQQLSELEIGDQALMILSEDNMNALMDNSGISSDKAQGPIDKWFYAKNESNGGLMDYGFRYFQASQGLCGTKDDNKGGFIIFGNRTTAYNLLDAGNFMWGQSMKNLKFDYSTAEFHSQRNENFHDPKADQRAIRNGYHYNISSEHKIMNSAFINLNVVQQK